MPTGSKGFLFLLVAACIGLAGCGDSSGGTSKTTTAAEGSSPQASATPSASADRKDARQNIARLADAQRMINRYAADFDEIAPLHAAAGDIAATSKDASTAYAAVGGFAQGLLIFDSPAAANRQLAAYKEAIRTAKQRLGEVGEGRDLLADVDRAKRAIDGIYPAAEALKKRLQAVVRGEPGSGA